MECPKLIICGDFNLPLDGIELGVVQEFMITVNLTQIIKSYELQRSHIKSSFILRLLQPDLRVEDIWSSVMSRSFSDCFLLAGDPSPIKKDVPTLETGWISK